MCSRKYVPKNISERIVWKLFLKGETIFSDNNGVLVEISWDQEETPKMLLNGAP